MITRNWAFSLIALLAVSATASAQQNLIGGGYGGYGGNNYNSQFLQNYYNRNNQPLSPYLNLLRGGNAATNYYYGVRPGSMGGPLNMPFTVGMGTQGRQTFFPQVDTLYELEDTKPGEGLRPTGHPFGFNNSLGYFGSGMMGSSQQQRGMMGARQSSSTRGR